MFSLMSCAAVCACVWGGGRGEMYSAGSCNRQVIRGCSVSVYAVSGTVPYTAIFTI